MRGAMPCGAWWPPHAIYLARRAQMLERISDQHDHGKTTGEAMTEPAKAGAGTAPVALDAPKSTDDTTNRKNMALLIQLRWTAVIGQIATIAFVDQWFGIALPILPMAGVIAALVALNLLSLVWVRYRAEINNRELLLALMLDVAALTGQLYLSGGATNPFTSLYLLQVTLGAVLLDARSTWSLVGLACLSFAWLTVAYRPLGLPQHGFSDPFSLHVAGMFIGFALNAVLLVVFVTRINRNLRERDANLAALRQHAAEQDAVDHGLQQVDVENVQECLHARHTPRYASLTVSLASISAEVPDALIVPASIR
jgi:two-component system sensor histidine kinase RegB